MPVACWVAVARSDPLLANIAARDCRRSCRRRLFWVSASAITEKCTCSRTWTTVDSMAMPIEAPRLRMTLVMPAESAVSRRADDRELGERNGGERLAGSAHQLRQHQLVHRRVGRHIDVDEAARREQQ